MLRSTDAELAASRGSTVSTAVTTAPNADQVYTAYRCTVTPSGGPSWCISVAATVPTTRLSQVMTAAARASRSE